MVLTPFFEFRSFVHLTSCVFLHVSFCTPLRSSSLWPSSPSPSPWPSVAYLHSSSSFLLLWRCRWRYLGAVVLSSLGFPSISLPGWFSCSTTMGADAMWFSPWPCVSIHQRIRWDFCCRWSQPSSLQSKANVSSCFMCTVCCAVAVPSWVPVGITLRGCRYVFSPSMTMPMAMTLGPLLLLWSMHGIFL